MPVRGMGRNAARLAYVLVCLLSIAVPSPAAAPVEVLIRGVEGAERKNVEAALALPPGLVRDGRVDQAWLARYLNRVPEKVSRALEPFGYYESRTEAVPEPSGDNAVRIIVTIQPGPPVVIDNVRVEIRGEGAGEESLRTLAEKFPVGRGDILNHEKYETAKGRLEARAQSLGYLDAGFPVHVIRVDRGRRSAGIDLVLDTGPLYRFGAARLAGAPDYPERFLRRYLAFKPWEDAFSYEKLGQTQLNFAASERFRDVLVAPRLDLAEDRRVPVDIALTPSPPKRLRVGAGYGTDTGARGSLNYIDINLFRRGHTFEATLAVAERKQTLGLSYTIPSPSNINSSTIFRVGADREDVSDYYRRSVFAEVDRTYAMGRGKLGTLYLRLLRERYVAGLEDSVSRLVLPGVRFDQRRYPAVSRPREGYHYNAEVRGTHEAVGSDIHLLQVLGNGNILVPLPSRFSVFARIQGAVTVLADPVRDIPVSLRFFAGGDQSVRGYDYQSLGPTDASGKVVGGRHLAVGSVEVERALGANWGVAAFYDAGNAFNSLTNAELFQGVGIGVRRYTVIGPVRVDLARQVGVSDPSFRLHIGVGFAW